MKKLTNLQMGVIVDKIYKELSEKIEPINKARLGAVDTAELLKGDKIAPKLLALEELEKQKRELDNKIAKTRKEASELYNSESTVYYYSTPSYETYLNDLKRKEANLIFIDKRDIEANVILSDVTDLETLIANITRSITKNIPELN